jgi:hypothetical protein
MSAPDQNGFAGILIREVKEPYFLPNGESLRYHGQAALRTDICSVSFGTLLYPRVVPLDGYRDAGIDTPTAANVTHPRLITHVLQQRHDRLLDCKTWPVPQPKPSYRMRLFYG